MEDSAEGNLIENVIKERKTRTIVKTGLGVVEYGLNNVIKETRTRKRWLGRTDQDGLIRKNFLMKLLQ